MSNSDGGDGYFRRRARAPPMSAPTAFTTADPDAAALPCKNDDGYADSTPPGAQANTWHRIRTVSTHVGGKCSVVTVASAARGP